MQSLHERHYLVFYCSPARAGKRRLRLDVTHTSTEGDTRKGSVTVDFDATGFGPGCDPSKPPHFGSANLEADSDSKPEGDKPDAGGKPETKQPDEEGATTPAPSK